MIWSRITITDSGDSSKESAVCDEASLSKLQDDSESRLRDLEREGEDDLRSLRNQMKVCVDNTTVVGVVGVVVVNQLK